MVRQKSLVISYRDISKIEESVEFLLLWDLNSDKLYEMLDIFSRLKYISETVSGIFSVLNDTNKHPNHNPKNNDQNFQFIDVIEFLYLEYFLEQMEILHSILNSIKFEIPYHPKIETLLNELNKVVLKIQRVKSSDRFNY